MIRLLSTVLLLALIFTGCSNEPGSTDSSDVAKAPLPEPDYDIPMRNFAAIKIGPYDVQPMFEEEIKDGHYNMKVTGAEFEAVRIWVGQEDPADTMVIRCELENDYQHGHLDIPNPIPDDVKLWIEIEDQDGDTHLGSVNLEHAL